VNVLAIPSEQVRPAHMVNPSKVPGVRMQETVSLFHGRAFRQQFPPITNTSGKSQQLSFAHSHSPSLGRNTR
jgi:hypothetical protein